MLVALNKSAVENGLRLKRDAAGPTAITVAVEMVVDTHSDLEEDVCERTPPDVARGSSDWSPSEKTL